MSKEALDKAQHKDIKTLAQQIIDSQQKEIDQMSKWKAEWTGEHEDKGEKKSDKGSGSKRPESAVGPIDAALLRTLVEHHCR